MAEVNTGESAFISQGFPAGTGVVDSSMDMECENSDNGQALYGLHWLPSKNLVFTAQQDAYTYYEDSVTGKQYSMDVGGFWYVWDEAKNEFVAVDEPTNTGAGQPPAESREDKEPKEPTSKRDVVGITFDEKGFPVFPTNAKGQPILPKDANDQPFFPVDSNDQPVFPYDHTTKKWTFPVDDTEEPIFPRNLFNKPIVPVDDNDKPIFPVDEKGEFIFPLDESHCPIPALTPSGRVVIPTDEFGELVIPRDREGRPLIHMAPDGVTPMSLNEFRLWKQNFRQNAKKNSVQEVNIHQQQPQMVNPTVMPLDSVPISVFHPLNLQQFSLNNADEIAMLQRSKRVRPEDIDLPLVATMENHAQMTTPANGENVESHQTTDEAGKADSEKDGGDEEEERARKRKKLLSAQLHFSKRVPLKVKQQQQPQRSGGGGSRNNNNNGGDKLQNQREPAREEQPPDASKSTGLSHNEPVTARSSESTPTSSAVVVKTEDRVNEAMLSTSRNHSGRRSLPSRVDNSGRKESKKHHTDDRDTPTSVTPVRTTYGDRPTMINDDITRITTNSETASSSLPSTIVQVPEEARGSKKNDDRPPSNCDSRSTYSDGEGTWNGSERDKKKSDLKTPERKHAKHEKSRSSSSRHKRKRNVPDERSADSDSDSVSTHNKKHRHSNSPESIDIAQLNEYSDLAVVQRLIKRSRRRYDDLKKKISRLEEEKALEKCTLKKLYEIETRVESRLGMEYMSSSDN